MLKQIRIKNFQNHRSTIINLAPIPGITGIVGDSLAGKTPIIRAVQKVVTNRPKGFDFHSDFDKKKTPTETQLTFNDAGNISKISLSNTKSKSIYKMEIADGRKSFKFRKTGHAIPDIIKEKLNLNDLNFSGQLEPHFLVTSSGGQVAKAISKITQADKIILWIKKAADKLSVLKESKKRLKIDIEEFDAKLESLKDLNKADTIIAELESVHGKEIELESRYWTIKDLLVKIEESQEEVEALKKYLRVKTLVRQIEQAERGMEALEQQERLILEAQDIQEEIKSDTILKNKYIRQYIAIIKQEKRCPTCFGKISVKTLRAIKKEYYEK